MSGEAARLTDILAAFVADTPAAGWPQAVADPAKDLILDTVGVALAAAHRPIGRILAAHIAEVGGSPATTTATVLGLGIKAPPAMAALANGTLANALDFDGGWHLPTHILPAALAVGEHYRHTGAAVLEAFVLGYEAAARLMQAIDVKRQKGGPTHRGWWHVGLVGPLASAMTAARLLRLDRHQTATAISIASCSSGGFRRNMGTMAKALHSGNAARAGIEAAMLARGGFTADAGIIEAPLGFLHAVCAPEDRDVTALTERLGRPFVLAAPLPLKRFPACNPAHPLIEAALALVHAHHVSADDIQSIAADLHTFSLLRTAPEDEVSAGFSGAFLIAATLVHGAFGLDQLSEDVVHDPRVRALMQRVHHVPAGMPETITVSLRDGKVVIADVLPVRRLTGREAVREKFRRCAELVLGRSACETVESAILALDEQPDLTRLMAAAAGSKQ